MNLYHFIWNVMDLRALQEIYGNIRKSSMIVTLFWILVDVDICWQIWISLEHEWPDPKISWDLLRFSPAHPDPTAPLQRLQRRAVHGGRPGSSQTLLGPGAFSGSGLREHLQTTIVLKGKSTNNHRFWYVLMIESVGVWVISGYMIIWP